MSCVQILEAIFRPQLDSASRSWSVVCRLASCCVLAQLYTMHALAPHPCRADMGKGSALPRHPDDCQTLDNCDIRRLAELSMRTSARRGNGPSTRW